jgi:flagellar basal body P-ring formation protein FlgA
VTVKLRQTACLLATLAAVPAFADGLPPAAVQQAEALAREAAAALAPAGARIEVSAGALDSRLNLAPCARTQASWPSGSAAWGKTRVGIRCVEGASAWNVYLPLTVKVFAPAPVAAAPLAVGTVVEAAHLRIAEADWAAEASPLQREPALVVGRTLGRNVGAGQPLRAADLRTRQWFAAGDTVRIVARGAGFSASGEGQALTPGLEGQPARVRTDSGRIVSGTASGERRIEIVL